MAIENNLWFILRDRAFQLKGGSGRSVPGVEALEARYDREADVLYVSFGAPDEADDAELTGEDIVLR